MSLRDFSIHLRMPIDMSFQIHDIPPPPPPGKPPKKNQATPPPPPPPKHEKRAHKPSSLGMNIL